MKKRFSYNRQILNIMGDDEIIDWAVLRKVDRAMIYLEATYPELKDTAIFVNAVDRNQTVLVAANTWLMMDRIVFSKNDTIYQSIPSGTTTNGPMSDNEAIDKLVAGLKAPTILKKLDLDDILKNDPDETIQPE